MCGATDYANDVVKALTIGIGGLYMCGLEFSYGDSQGADEG